MAVTVTALVNSPSFKSWSVIATADADTTATINHGFPDGGVFVTILPREQATAALSGWAMTALSTTQITMTKSVAVGSGSANVQLEVRAVEARAFSARP